MSYNGVQFGDWCFSFTYSLESSSTPFLISSSFDATGLENYLSFGGKSPSSTSYVVKNPTELNSIPLDVEDMWIGRFDTTGITYYSFNRFWSLKSLVIGNGVFWSVSSFEMSSLPSLRSIRIGTDCFLAASSFSLISLIY